MTRTKLDLAGTGVAALGVLGYVVLVAQFVVRGWSVDPISIGWALLAVVFVALAAFAIATHRLRLAWTAGIIGFVPFTVILVPTMWLIGPACYLGGVALLTAASSRLLATWERRYAMQ